MLLRFAVGTVNGGTASYALYTANQQTIAATGHKQAFCIEDVDQAPGFYDQPPLPADQLFTCDKQGLHVGYWDVYPIEKPCQWIDITDVPPGNYWLSITVNYKHVIAESDYSNNEVRVP